MTSKPHVLTVSYTQVLDDPRVIAESRILASLGYRVTLLGVGLGAAPGRTSADGVNVTILPLIHTHNPVKLVRALLALLGGKVESASSREPRSNFVSLLLFNLWFLRVAIKDRPAVIHCQEHQPMPMAWLVARLLRIAWVYDAHENTSLNRSGMGFKGGLTIRIERFFLSRADAVITVGERLARSLRARGARRVVVVGNWKRPEDFQTDAAELQTLRKELELTNAKLVMAYFGTLDTARDIEVLLESLRDEPGVHLLIAGRGEFEEAVAAAASGWSNVHWLRWLPFDLVPRYTQLSDVVYCCINTSLAQLDFVMPNKLFDAFAAGKAVIAREGSGEMDEILMRYPAAIVLNDVTVESLRGAFRQLQDPDVLHGLQAHAAAGGREYNSDVAVDRLKALFESLVAGPQARGALAE